MSHTVVYSKYFARSKPKPVATIDTANPDYDDILTEVKGEEYRKARAEGRERPIITTELVDHDVPLVPVRPLDVEGIRNAIPKEKEKEGERHIKK